MWLFDKLFVSDEQTNTINDILFDGAHIAVSTGKKVVFFSYWTEDAEYEDRYNTPDFTPTGNLPLPVFFTWDLSSVATNNLFYLAKEGNNLFVTDGSEYGVVYRLDLSTRLKGLTKTTADSTYTLPTSSNARFAAANDKLWFTDLATMDQIDPERQKLYSYDIFTLTYNSDDIPTRKQFEPVQIVYGNSTYIWLTNYNNVSVMKYSVLAGAWASTVRTARSIKSIYANQNNQVFVGSVNGLVQSINQSTDFVTQLLGTSIDGVSCDGLVEDGTFVWAVSEDLSLARVNKTTYDARFTNGTAGYKIGSSSVTYPFAGSARKITITEPITYQYWNGSSFDTRNVRRYVFVVTNNKIYGWRCQAMYRENSYQVRCTAMIATGSEKYYGDDT